MHWWQLAYTWNLIFRRSKVKKNAIKNTMQEQIWLQWISNQLRVIFLLIFTQTALAEKKRLYRQKQI